MSVNVQGQVEGGNMLLFRVKERLTLEQVFAMELTRMRTKWR